MSKLKEKSKTSSKKNKKDHGTRNMIIFLVIFSIVCIDKIWYIRYSVPKQNYYLLQLT